MISVLWSFADTGPVIEPQPFSLWLFLGDFQPLSSPDTFDTLMVHLPAIISQQCRYSSVAISAVLQSKAGNCLGQKHFIIWWFYLVTLNGAMLTKNLTCPALRNRQTLLNCFDTVTATIRA